MTASNDLLQLQQRPTYYDDGILSKVEAAMAAQAETDRLRVEEFKWRHDEGQMVAPDPINPGQDILEDAWEDTTGLPLPEDMTPDHHTILELMEAFGQESDPYSGIHAVFQIMKQYAINGVWR